MKKHLGKLAPIALLLTLATLLGGLSLQAEDLPTPPLRLTALAINLGANRPVQREQLVEITVNRYSTEAERGELLDSLRLHGQDSLLKALQENPPVGTIRTPDSVAWDLHYAHVTPDPNGGLRIFLATDRRIAFWEAFNTTRSLDYPFTLIEIHLDASGHGEGRLSIATKVVADSQGKFLRLEDFSVEPTRLQGVQVQKK